MKPLHLSAHESGLILGALAQLAEQQSARPELARDLEALHNKVAEALDDGDGFGHHRGIARTYRAPRPVLDPEADEGTESDREPDRPGTLEVRDREPSGLLDPGDVGRIIKAARLRAERHEGEVG